MPCLFAMFAGIFPRLGTLFIWIARPSNVQRRVQRQLVVADPGDHLPAVHHTDVCDPVEPGNWTVRLGLVLDRHGSGDRPDALEQHSLSKPQLHSWLY